MNVNPNLIQLQKECLECRKCSIGGQIINNHPSNVFSNMNPTPIMVIGQNPGKEETEQHEPFVGVSGKNFNQIMEKTIGLKRNKFYISNCIRCYTPSNRQPTPEELENCQTFLIREMQIVKPVIIITLGAHALKQLTGLKEIMKHHGQTVFSNKFQQNVFPMIHPSPINLNNPRKMKIFVEDAIKFKITFDKLIGL